MTTSNDFDFFLKHGFIEGLNPSASMEVLLTQFGEDKWYVREVENNGLVYGIIKVGFIEFHIYNEQLSGVSYRLDISYDENEFDVNQIPWIVTNRTIDKVESILAGKNVSYNTIRVKGPLPLFKTKGAIWYGLENEEYTYLDTVGGVTFAFNTKNQARQIEATQVCKYYNSKIDSMIV